MAVIISEFELVEDRPPPKTDPVAQALERDEEHPPAASDVAMLVEHLLLRALRVQAS